MSINGHPIHPAAVHFPISFITLAYSFDLLHGLTPYLPSLSSLLPVDIPIASLPTFAHHLRALGLLTAIPAVLTGVQQLYVMTSGGKGLFEKSASGSQQLRPRVKMTLLHAAANDAVLIATAIVWWQERAAITGKGVGGGVFGLKDGLGSVGLLVAATATPLMLWAANLGGTLTYNYGVGINLAKTVKGKAT